MKPGGKTDSAHKVYFGLVWNEVQFSHPTKTAPTETMKMAWLHTQQNCYQLQCICKDQWPPNLYDLRLMDCHVWGAMLECYILTQAGKHRQAQESELIWDQLTQDSIYKSMLAPQKDFELVWLLVVVDTLNICWN